MMRRHALAKSALGLAFASLVLVGCGSEADPGGSSAGDTASAGEAPPVTEAPADTDGGSGVVGEGGMRPEDVSGPGAVAADLYHPDQREVEPALGGTVVMHISAQPPNLNFALENSASVRWILLDVHSALLRFNRETWEFDYDLATSLDIEDMVLLKDGDVRYGMVSDAGDAWKLTPGSDLNDQGEQTIAKSDVERVERGTVLTFRLRDDAVWHDGHLFDAHDVKFSYDIYKNPVVDCDEKRFKYKDDVFACDVIDDHAVRFFYKEQYFDVASNFGFDFCVLPSHRYNLLDEDNPDHDPGVDPNGEAQGEYINEHPNNRMWVGLGPYRITDFRRDEFIAAERFADYWIDDPRETGYFDTLRWQLINNDDSAFQALLAGNLDIFYRVKTEDYKGAATQAASFTDKFYKAHTYVGNVGYTTWNMYQPHLSDVRVRTALSHAFDVRGWIATNYRGLAVPVSGTMFRMGIGYNTDIPVNEYDPDLAVDLLADAGWYDRDGDGIVDKDGQNLVIEALMPSGNKASERFLQKLQNSFAEVGVGVTITALEWAQFLERLHDRTFDAGNLAWTLPTPESDPFQLWYSTEGAYENEGSNHSGLQDEQVDALIDAGRRELDPAKRSEIWHQLHARIYELQPYLFGWNVPRKVAVNKKLRGVKLYNFEPGFSLRDMYYEYDPANPDLRPVPEAYR